jgi:hypothetical protein
VSVSAVLYPRWPALLKIEISSNGQNCSILSQKVPKFQLLKHNDELLNIYYGIFRGEDFFKISSPLFLICIIGQNRQKFKVHIKSRNICSKAHHYAYTVQIWALSGLK